MRDKALWELLVVAFLYSLVFMVPEGLAASPSEARRLVALILPLFAAALFVFVRLSGMWGYCGLSCSRDDVSRIARASLPFAVLLFVPLANVVDSWGRAWNPPLSTLVISVCAAVVEELCFRGYLLSILLSCIRRPCAAVLLASIAFAGLHLFNIGTFGVAYVAAQLVVAGCMGMAFGFMRLCTRSIYPCIVAHVLINVTANGVMLYHDDGLWLVCVVAIAAGVWSHFWWKKRCGVQAS